MFSRLGLVASIALVLGACGGGGGDPAVAPPVNRAPIATADSARIRPGVSVDLDVLANDRDDDGDALSIEAPGTHVSAAFEVLAGNRLRVTPVAGFSGTLTFSYRVRDGRGAYSAPTNVVVDVGPLARAMVGLAPTAAGSPRLIIAGAPDEQRDILTFGPCNQQAFAIIAADGRRMLGRRCLSTTRADVVLALPRATTLQAPTVVYGNAALAPGQALVGNFAELLVAERVSNPDDLTLGSTYDLVRVDVAQGAAVQRMPLPGIDHVSLVRPGGAPRRALLLASETNGDWGHFLADLDAGTVRRITAPDDLSIEYSTLSPDGRFLISNWPSPDRVLGYDTQGAAQQQTLWTAPGVGPTSYITNTQFLPQPGATLLVEVTDLTTRDVVAWIVPLASPSSARELVRFASGSGYIRFQVRDGIGVYAENAGGGRAHLNRVRISTGEVLGPLTPAGGVLLQSVDLYNGTSLLFTMLDDTQQRRGARIRVDAPGVVQVIAPSLVAEMFSLTIDQDETTIGLRAANNAGVVSAWIVDVNQPAAAVPLAPALQPGEAVTSVLALGSPDT